MTLDELRRGLAECQAKAAAAPVFVRPHLAPLLALLAAIVLHIERLSDDRTNHR